MASVGIVEKYKWLVKRLFPTGWAWNFGKENSFTVLADVMAEEPARLEERGLDFLGELNPVETFEMLENWERLLKLPDECDPTDIDLTLFERRARVLQKLTTGGGQSKAFFKLIAQQLGYDADIIDVLNFRDFRVGTARVGDPLTNSTLPGGAPGPQGWAYAFQVFAPAELVRRFKVGRSSVGERLVYIENRTLECVIRKYAPAHVTVIFSFGE